jgi:putative Mn2+ efflux pump MntP
MNISLPYIFLLSLSLAMDAFAVSISAGISGKRSNLKESVRIAFFFGLFQAVMPLIGFYLARSFYDIICSVDHWIAFFLLAFIGGKMILEAIKKGDTCEVFPERISTKRLLVLAVATSIDALAAGVSLSILCTDIFIPVTSIGIITFLLSFLGVYFGKKLGCKFGSRAEIIGGIVLILIGLKVLISDLF